MKELMDPVTQNRMISALLMMFITTFLWGWLNEHGLPMNLLLGGGIVLMVFDLVDFSRDPKPGPILVGAILVPFWPVLRFFIR
jgi:hypothetical protein